MYLIIQNKGEVDVNAFVLMGASTKEGQDKIGFFGSGNKYAIATLLRSGYDIRIFSGKKEILVETHVVTLGSQTFQQIYIDGKSTSLTTRMGPEWEVWFALREFICNAKDEGDVAIDVGECTSEEGYTRVCVEYRDEVKAFMDSYDNYIYDRTPLLETKEGIAIIEKEDRQLNIYRKGISVIGKNDFKSLYNYNIQNLDINESRIFKYEFEVRKGICIALSQGDEAIVKNFLDHVSDTDVIENNLDYWDSCDNFSMPWHDQLVGKRIYPRSIVAYMPPEDIYGGIVLEDDLATALSKTFNDLAVYGKGHDGWIEREPSEELKANVDKAIKELDSLGLAFNHHITYGICTVDSTMAMFKQKENKLWLSIDYLEDYDELMLTLIEEDFHTKGYHDGSRHFEHILMEKLLSCHRQIAVLKDAANNMPTNMAQAMETISNLSKALANK